MLRDDLLHGEKKWDFKVNSSIQSPDYKCPL